MFYAKKLDRRAFLAGAVASGAITLSSRYAFAAAEKSANAVGIWGPPVGPSIALAHLTESSAIQDAAPGSVFRVWRTPDQMRAGLVSGEMEVTIVPTYTGANLFNRGLPVKMANVMTWGLLYMMSTDKAVTSLSNIGGKTIVMPFRNDMPDLVFRHILGANGMSVDKDVNVIYTATPLEAVQYLLSGRVDTAILPEPLATASILKGLGSSIAVNRVLSLQDEWGRATGRAPFIPQAGAVVIDGLLARKPDFVTTFNAQAARSTDWVNNNPASAGRLAQDYLEIAGPVIEKSIPYSNLRVVSATDARADLEFFFETLARQSPDIIGGKLPADEFYLSL
ncbi:ABC transporter substrate-binding protein [Thalassospira sp.]|uniref:ABC transporter substrate-binding protein n=1 Tax=Thalassospira sp. TaxID=1912094 RepID=UPI003AA8D39E